MKKLIVSAFALAAFVFSANAQVNEATTGGVSAATLQAPISITEATTGDFDALNNEVKDGNNLDFGVINIVSAGGTVTVGNNSAWSATAGMTEGSGSTPNAAGFEISGTDGLTYTVDVAQTVALTKGASTMNITSFTNSANGTIGANNVFLVGGTLTIPANASVGAYVGAFEVTVAYN